MFHFFAVSITEQYRICVPPFYDQSVFTPLYDIVYRFIGNISTFYQLIPDLFLPKPAVFMNAVSSNNRQNKKEAPSHTCRTMPVHFHPFRLYFSHVSAKTGQTATSSDGSPILFFSSEHSSFLRIPNSFFIRATASSGSGSTPSSAAFT